MRVLFTACASPPHYYPLVPLAWALRNEGHEVRIAATPGLVDTVASSGLTVVQVGADTDLFEVTRQQMELDKDAEVNPAVWRELRKGKGPRALRIFLDAAEAMIDDAVDFARAWRPDLVVHGPTTYAGPVTAAVLGVPNVRIPMCPDVEFRAAAYERDLLAPLSARFGGGEVTPLGTLTVDPCPASMQTPSNYPRQLVRYIPYNGPGEMEHWLLEPPAGRRVAVTWGTSLAKINPNLVLAGPMIRALADADTEVVAAIAPSHRALLGPVPDRVRIVEQLPLHMLLPTCDAIVHQGGNGTTMTSVVCGTPQLIVPQFPDQAFVAAHVGKTGAGVVLNPEDASPAAVRDTVTALIEPEGTAAKAAAALRDEAAAHPAPTEVVSVLEKLASPFAAPDPAGQPSAAKTSA
jgi:UDP:flavonoid glycosyltransferase YjiC (YdhE family)